MKLKTRYPFMSIRLEKIQKPDNDKCGGKLGETVTFKFLMLITGD